MKVSTLSPNVFCDCKVLHTAISSELRSKFRLGTYESGENSNSVESVVAHNNNSVATKNNTIKCFVHLQNPSKFEFIKISP